MAKHVVAISAIRFVALNPLWTILNIKYLFFESSRQFSLSLSTRADRRDQRVGRSLRRRVRPNGLGQHRQPAEGNNVHADPDQCVQVTCSL